MITIDAAEELKILTRNVRHYANVLANNKKFNLSAKYFHDYVDDIIYNANLIVFFFTVNDTNDATTNLFKDMYETNSDTQIQYADRIIKIV